MIVGLDGSWLLACMLACMLARTTKFKFENYLTEISKLEIKVTLH
jgi:hypothetical protein